MKRFIIFLFLLLINIVADAQQDNVVQAKEEYQKGNYAQAIVLYNEIIEEGFESDDLYYNLGNAYYKNKDIPNAILYYERAKRLNPSDEDIDFNLKVAEQSIVDKIEPLPAFFLSEWYNSMTELFTTDGWAWMTICLFFLFFLLLFLYFFSRNMSFKKNAFYTSLFCFFLSIVTVFFAFEQHNKQTRQTEAIIFTPTVAAKSSPDNKGTDIFIIHEGVKVTITDNLGEWSEIKLSNGSKGWVKTSDYVII